MYVRHIIKQNYTLDVAQHTFSQRNKAKNKSKTKKAWGWEEEVGARTGVGKILKKEVYAI